ncbi:TetR/AcrR family transcriptional regulator [Vibrio sp. Vb339]|uniref:TetR/AcrR family transcriptional regulator n=1 Tax=Vibrio sp. Vb339 TaxID=1192013 RepID=UPI0015530A09|nr:TetR/AcrR family transcriptional regulator [Vibrio sp. Vb339]
MPWEKSFNMDLAIENAMLLFWEKGYTDASMSEILKVTGLTKGSFYNAFGSKQALFINALQMYGLGRRDIVIKLIELDSPKEALETFFSQLIDETIDDQNKKGCFIINTLLRIDSFDVEIQKITKKGMKNAETFFKQMIELGQSRGEISQYLIASELATYFVSSMVSIRVLGRGTYSKSQLESISNHSLANIRS